jgi:hypothetical protein
LKYTLTFKETYFKFQAGGSDLEKGAKENKGFETVERSNAVAPLKESSGDKWVNNYVPYGDYPKGTDAKKQVVINDLTSAINVYYNTFCFGKTSIQPFL